MSIVDPHDHGKPMLEPLDGEHLLEPVAGATPPGSLGPPPWARPRGPVVRDVHGRLWRVRRAPPQCPWVLAGWSLAALALLLAILLVAVSAG
jgi:hypothetical protein